MTTTISTEKADSSEKVNTSGELTIPDYEMKKVEYAIKHNRNITLIYTILNNYDIIDMVRVFDIMRKDKWSMQDICNVFNSIYRLNDGYLYNLTPSLDLICHIISYCEEKELMIIYWFISNHYHNKALYIRDITNALHDKNLDEHLLKFALAWLEYFEKGRTFEIFSKYGLPEVVTMKTHMSDEQKRIFDEEILKKFPTPKKGLLNSIFQ